MTEEQLTELNGFITACKSFTAVGSRVTCDPPPTDTDADFLAWVPSRTKAAQGLVELGFETTTDEDYDGEKPVRFTSWKRAELNILVSEDGVFCRRFLAATAVAKHLNLMIKADRQILFRAILYGRGPCDGETQ